MKDLHLVLTGLSAVNVFKQEEISSDFLFITSLFSNGFIFHHNDELLSVDFTSVANWMVSWFLHSITTLSIAQQKKTRQIWWRDDRPAAGVPSWPPAPGCRVCPGPAPPAAARSRHCSCTWSCARPRVLSENIFIEWKNICKVRRWLSTWPLSTTLVCSCSASRIHLRSQRPSHTFSQEQLQELPCSAIPPATRSLETLHWVMGRFTARVISANTRQPTERERETDACAARTHCHYATEIIISPPPNPIERKGFGQWSVARSVGRYFNFDEGKSASALHSIPCSERRRKGARANLLLNQNTGIG